MDDPRLLRLLSNHARCYVRVGRVSSANADKHTVDVKFSDIEDSVSPPLSMLMTRSGDYSLPAEDDLVVCLMLEGVEGFGFVLGSIYSSADAAPLDDAGQRSIAGDDLRLGDPEATDAVALAPAVKSELDKVKGELNKIATTLGTGNAPPGGGTVTFTTPYVVGYNPTEPAAEKVRAK